MMLVEQVAAVICHQTFSWLQPCLASPGQYY